jgi:hypothetical protein
VLDPRERREICSTLRQAKMAKLGYFLGSPAWAFQVAIKRTQMPSPLPLPYGRAPKGPLGRAPKGDGGQSSLLTHPYQSSLLTHPFRRFLRSTQVPFPSLSVSSSRKTHANALSSPLLSLSVEPPKGSLSVEPPKGSLSVEPPKGSLSVEPAYASFQTRFHSRCMPLENYRNIG